MIIVAFFIGYKLVAGTITEITIQKKNKERVNIFIDNTFAFAITLNAALALKKGQYLNEQDIVTLKFKDSVDKAYLRTLNYLSYRARSCREIKDYLGKKEESTEVISLVINRLIDDGYVNDLEFGKAWVESRERLNPKGERALRYELTQKGLTFSEIDEILANLDEEALAWQAVTKKLKQWQKLNEVSFKQKLMGYLSRRGFSYEVIQATFIKAWDPKNQ